MIPRLVLLTSVVAGMQLWAPAGWTESYTYEIDAQIRYDVVADGVTLPDTPVWGMPGGVELPSGKLVLDVDASGNVSGASPLQPTYGLGMLYGERLYKLYNSTFQLTGGSWETPTASVAPITGGTVDLGDTLIGDFSGLNNISGFIKDGNSGNSFDLSNGLGLDGKLEFTATGPDGMSLTFLAKTTNAGAGTGWYSIAVDGGDISYSNGTDAASTGVVGVVSYQAWIDPTTRSLSFPEQTLLEGFPADWWQLGRRIDAFDGAIDPAGNFVGTAHFAGIDFTSLAVDTTNGTFQDGNSPAFDASNGLVLGDTLTVVMTDSTGRFDLVIDGTLVSQTGATTTTTVTTTTTLPLPPLDHFVKYRVRTTPGTARFTRFGFVVLTDQFGTANYNVVKARALALPADKNQEGLNDPATHLGEYRIRSVAGVAKFRGRKDVRIINQCNDLFLRVVRPVALMVPTAKGLSVEPPAPDPNDHNLDHFLCYKTKVQRRGPDGNRLPRFPKGTQVEVTDQFQARRYDLVKVTRLCNPVAKDEDPLNPPVLLSGVNSGDPKPIAPASIRNPTEHLVCYQARLAEKTVVQSGCGCDTAADPSCTGASISAAQRVHTPVRAVQVNSQFGPQSLDTIKRAGFCIPSIKMEN